MKKHLISLIFSIGFVSLFGQTYEGPFPQITSGYGAFGNHPIAEKKFDNTFLLEHGMNHGDDGVELTMRYPADLQGPVPTVLFASGWGQYSPDIFSKLLDFIASKGYCVVFTPYPTDQSNGHTWENSLYNGMKQAIEENTGANPGDDNIIDTTRIGFFGHSLGAGDIFWLGYKFYVDHGYGANAKFLFSVAGWIGFNMTEAYLANYPADCKLRVEIWEEDDHDPSKNPPGNTSPRIQYYLFHQINIPDSEKNYIKILGGPDQNGYHYATDHKLVTMDQFNALDYYAIFRPLDAMMDWTFNGVSAAKDLALGFDTDMGPFPDLDKDYNTFVFAYDESTYEYPCAVNENPFKDQCPAAPLAIELRHPLRAILDNHQVLLEWATEEEHKNKGFQVERSRDGVQWKPLIWVEGHGNSSAPATYRVKDTSPFPGTNYYRFVQRDFDGQTNVSNVVSVGIQGLPGQVQLAPNPARDRVMIYHAPSDRIERVVLYSITGKAIRIYEHPANELDFSKIRPGMYIASIRLKSGMVEKLPLILH